MRDVSDQKREREATGQRQTGTWGGLERLIAFTLLFFCLFVLFFIVN